MNYTARQRILQDKAIVLLHVPKGQPAWFSAEINLDELKLPHDAEVHVEAHYLNSYQRFRFGTVARIAPDSENRLTGFSDPTRLLFRVKVVSASGKEGLILAEADRLTPTVVEGDAPRQTLLWIEWEDLKDELWRVRFGGERPILVVNNAGALGSRMRDVVVNDPAFGSLVYPAVLRQILWHFVVDEQERDDDDDDESRPAGQWFKFARRFSSASVPEVDGASDDSLIEVTEWVDTVTERFAAWANARGRFLGYLGAGM